MTPVTTFAGRRVALFGLGGSGIATALALMAGGAEVAAWDDNEASRAKAEARGIATADLRAADWSGFVALVLAPGVPLTHPAPHWTVQLARRASLEIIGDIELFCRERAKIAPGSPFVAITGTNGKSTTTALVAHILAQAGRDVQMGGNIGTAILSLEPPSAERVHVIEMSSFQIDLTPSLGAASSPVRHAEEAGEAGRLEARTSAVRASRRASGAPQHDAGEGCDGHGRGPTIGVLMNITPDHLDRHGTLADYAAIKARLIAGSDVAVIGVEDEESRAIAASCERASGRIIRVSDRACDGECVTHGADRLTARVAGESRTFVLAGLASLRGAHNAQNASVAVAVATLLGFSHDAIAAGLRSFPGLAHRMEEVARLGPTVFVNDSKATNADSAGKALASFPGGIHWILGGKPKEGGIESLRPLFPRVERAYLVGEAADAFARTLDGAVPVARCGTLDRAVAQACAGAGSSEAAEPVVLLSPACASYDQYPNFEVRGDAFRDLVRALPGVEMRS